jgi:hypothetical protein
MKIHLVAIDLDGTLLTSAKQISEVSAAILRQVRVDGVHVVLATARPPRSVKPFYDLLDLDTPMINYNGALVYDPPGGRVLLHRPVQPKVAVSAVNIARRVYPEVVVHGEVMDRWCTDRDQAAYQTETGKLFRPDLVAPLSEWLPDGVTKLLLLGQGDRLLDAAQAILRKHRYDITIMQTEDHLLQIMHKTVSKVQALRVVCGELGVTQDQVLAIGDNANDVGMLQWAGIGVAMGNAVPEAKAAANVVTEDHDSDGVAQVIHRILIQGLTVQQLADEADG